MKKISYLFFHLRAIIISLFAPVVLPLRDSLALWFEKKFTLGINFVASGIFPALCNYQTKTIVATTKEKLDSLVNAYIQSLNPDTSFVYSFNYSNQEPGRGQYAVQLIVRIQIPVIS